MGYQARCTGKKGGRQRLDENRNLSLIMERQGPEWNVLWCLTRLKRPASGAGHGGRGGHHDPFGPKMIFNYPERTGVLPYRDTESQFPRDHLTIASPSGWPEERRRLAAYPAVHSASAAMMAVSATNAPLFPASAPTGPLVRGHVLHPRGGGPEHDARAQPGQGPADSEQGQRLAPP
jgi:hypothetical protein